MLSQTAKITGFVAAIGLLGFCISYQAVYHAERYIVSGLVAVGYSAAPLVNLVAPWPRELSAPGGGGARRRRSVRQRG